MTRYGSRKLVHRWRSVDPPPHLRLTLKLLSAPFLHISSAVRAQLLTPNAPFARPARSSAFSGHVTHDIAEQHYIYAQAINASRRHVAMMEELRSQAMDEEGYSSQHRPEISQLSSSMACDICLVIAPEPDPA